MSLCGKGKNSWIWRKKAEGNSGRTKEAFAGTVGTPCVGTQDAPVVLGSTHEKMTSEAYSNFV